MTLSKDEKKRKRQSNMYRFMCPDEYSHMPNARVPSHAIWKGLKDRSTSHGIPHIDTAPGRLKRGIWCFITLATIAALTYNLEEIIRKYVKKDVSVIVTLNHANRQKFPAVTLCNMNPFKKTSLQQNSDLGNLLGISNSGPAASSRRKRSIIITNCIYDNYHTASGYCFALNSATNRYIWSDASSQCSSGWESAVIDTQAKYEFIRDNAYIFASLPAARKRYWINGMKYNGSYIWDSTGEAFSFTAWNSNPGNETCVYGDRTDGHMWGTALCVDEYLILCQKQETPTTDSLSTITPTTDSLSTAEPTTDNPSTITPTTDSPSTITPTTDSPSTITPTTDSPSTVEPTTDSLSTITPTTDSPSTITPTTDSPSTVEPTTDSPSTVTPITHSPSTATPTTDSPSTATPTTHSPSTATPTTDSPSTITPTTDSPSTITPTTDSPSTVTPITDSPSTLSSSSTTPTSTTSTTTVPSLTTQVPPPVPAPVPVAGSVFPERIQSTQEFTQEEKTYEVLANIPEEAKKSLGYSSADFIIDCQYAGYKCDHSDFSFFYNAIHGNCYVFNSGWNSSNEVEWSNQLGPRLGLKVVVNINQDEYVEQFGSASGVRIVVHSQEKMPFPEDEGVMAKTGYLTSISVTKVSIKKQGLPYTECVPEENQDLSVNVFAEHYDVKYSTLACFKTCYQQYVISDCGCADPGYPSYGAAFGYADVKACNSSDIKEDDCRYNITKLYSANELVCNCKDPCVEDVYIPELSESRWPSDMSKDFFISRHYDQLHSIVSSNDTEKLRENLAKVEVYFREFDFETIEEKPSYTDQSFITDIGGTMGLWIGWSFITAFEFMEFFVDLIVLVFTRKCSGKVKISTDIGANGFTSTDNMLATNRKLPRRSHSYIHQDTTPEQMAHLHRIHQSYLPSGSDTYPESRSSSSSMDSEMSKRLGYSRSKSRQNGTSLTSTSRLTVPSSHA